MTSSNWMMYPGAMCIDSVVKNLKSSCSCTPTKLMEEKIMLVK